MTTEEKLDKLESEIKALREEMRKPAEWPELHREVLELRTSGYISRRLWDGDESDVELFERGRIFPHTPEGREAAEWFSFCEGFRARWKRSADVKPNEVGFGVRLENGEFTICLMFRHYGLPKWSTEKACRAFIDSEGGADKFKEILERGIL